MRDGLQGDIIELVEQWHSCGHVDTDDVHLRYVIYGFHGNHNTCMNDIERANAQILIDMVSGVGRW